MEQDNKLKKKETNPHWSCRTCIGAVPNKQNIVWIVLRAPIPVTEWSKYPNIKSSDYPHGLKYSRTNRGNGSFNLLYESTHQGHLFMVSRKLPHGFTTAKRGRSSCSTTRCTFSRKLLCFGPCENIKSPCERKVRGLQLLGNHLSARPSSRPLSPERSKESKVCGLITARASPRKQWSFLGGKASMSGHEIWPSQHAEHNF